MQRNEKTPMQQLKIKFFLTERPGECKRFKKKVINVYGCVWGEGSKKR